MNENDLLARYATAAVPRYTSYPSANLWTSTDEAFARRFYQGATEDKAAVYVHVPFCWKLCLYCGCNMLVTRSAALVERYLNAIEAEIEHVARSVSTRPIITQLHLGGGTPTYLDCEQLVRLVGAVDRAYTRSPDCEASIEVHPPVTTRNQLETLRTLGFSRVSMGVQDFDPAVQARIRRPQPYEQTRALIDDARALGFSSVNIDLMYGLPLQTPQRFEHTLELVTQLRPERIALFGYAHMPVLKRHQALLSQDLPNPSERLELLRLAIDRLERAGYVYVGLDHFALPSDELCTARTRGTLRRNFMGYTTQSARDVLAFGPSAIAEVDGDYLQNARDVIGWADRVERGLFAGTRGWRSSADDRKRRAVVHDLFCHLRVDRNDALTREHAPMLAALAKDGLVTVERNQIRVTQTGQLFLRNIAAVFDAYLAPAARPHSMAV